jgi:hypothetical protein
MQPMREESVSTKIIFKGSVFFSFQVKCRLIDTRPLLSEEWTPEVLNHSNQHLKEESLTAHLQVLMQHFSF